MTIRFDAALTAALGVARRVSDEGVDVVLVRNVLGRVALVLGSIDRPPSEETIRRASGELRTETGPFCSNNPVLVRAELAAPGAVEDAPSRIIERERPADSAQGPVNGRLVVVERTVVGGQWASVTQQPPGRRRVTLYGFKGGVGRSTATTLLAQHLARQDRCVLVVDLDLESPGVGALLLDDEQLPDHGIVDHLVEAAVGNAEGLECVARSTVVTPPGNGEVWVAPAGGRPRDGSSYLPKLNRAYLDSPPFAQRLDDTVQACERQVEELSRTPDVVLLDSRAGLHDIAAIAITRLSDLSLLFAIDNAHTWAGYRELFRQWGADPERAVAVRQRLRMVAAAVPTARSAYLRSFTDRAQTCLAELYDSVAGEDLSSGPADGDGYNPALEDRDAPHSPLPIRYQPTLVGLDAGSHREWCEDPLVLEAYDEFLGGAADLIDRSVS